MKHFIHHATSLFPMERDWQERKLVGCVEASSLEEALALTQNGRKAWNPEDPCRSTRTGDVIQDDYGIHLVLKSGFRTLSRAEAPITE